MKATTKNVKAFGNDAADAKLQQLNIREGNPQHMTSRLKYYIAVFAILIFTQ